MSEFDSPNYEKYIYEKKSEGRVRAGRFAMVLLYVVFTVGLVAALIASGFVPVVAIVPLLLYILYLCTWRLVKYEIYYEFREGRLELGKIKRSRQGARNVPKLSVHVKEAIEIAPFVSADQYGDARLYDYSESQKSDKRIIVIFEQGGKKCAALIEGTPKIARLLSSFCPMAHDLKNFK